MLGGPFWCCCGTPCYTCWEFINHDWQPFSFTLANFTEWDCCPSALMPYIEGVTCNVPAPTLAYGTGRPQIVSPSSGYYMFAWGGLIDTPAIAASGCQPNTDVITSVSWSFYGECTYNLAQTEPSEIAYMVGLGVTTVRDPYDGFSEGDAIGRWQGKYQWADAFDVDALPISEFLYSGPLTPTCAIDWGANV